MTADTTVLRVSAMSSEHLAAVLAFLHEHHATRLHLEAMVDALLDLLDPAEPTGPIAELITHELTGESIASVDQHTWLEATTLVRGIRRELGSRA